MLDEVRRGSADERHEWLRQQKVPELIDAAVGALLEDRPTNVKGWLARHFAKQEADEVAGRSPTRLCSKLGPCVVELVHFNDVYNIEPQGEDGGASRFVAWMKDARQSAQSRGCGFAALFSGDAFNPSVMSTVTKGKQMVPILNSAGVDCSVYGNHDFDFGIETLEYLARQCRFPWLLSNAFSRSNGRPLASGAATHILDVPGTERRIGLLGLVEREWMATLATVQEDDVDYEDFCDCARRLVPTLRQQGCDAIVALTHMRVPNDHRLAEECGDILDLILGGHDHHYDVRQVGRHGTWVLKSGTDFRELTQLQLEFGDGPRPRVTNVHRVAITADMREDPECAALVQEYRLLVGEKMDQVLGETLTPLEVRFPMIRTRETNIANFVADIMRKAAGTDVALLNSGTLRSARVVPAGPIRMKDLTELLPMVDELCVLRMTGEQLLRALENGVSQYPRHEGRFPCVSGVRFAFDAQRPPGSRVVPGSISVGGNPFRPDAHYRLVTKEYIGLLGKDGFDVFLDCQRVEVSLPHLSALLRDEFTDLAVLAGATAKRRRVSLWRSGPGAGTPQQPPVMPGIHHADAAPLAQINPQVDGRIECINPDPAADGAG
eukprot:TRINITY_DN17074_c0_g1_i1.p1 TRINITY_DN17074_c0_g1~~TRINITY_DN17074_c0_g1_i1.p1  ORF type:complete len:634 (+),score=185.96 TRINITY_DN17074_c0_g1_i1:84-1904(+)